MLFLENWVLNPRNAFKTKMWAKWFPRKLGNSLTPRLFRLSVESIVVGDGMLNCTRERGGGGEGCLLTIVLLMIRSADMICNHNGLGGGH